MTETGWPLIPREVLPAPVPAAKRRQPSRPASPADPSRQLPIFGAGTTEPSAADLAGLLAGPGTLGRMGGTARVSIPVDAAWRVHVLVDELVVRGLVVTWRPMDEQVRQDEPPGPADTPPPVDEPEIPYDPDFEDLGAPAIGATVTRSEEPVAAPSPTVSVEDETTPVDAEEPLPVIEPRFEVRTAYSRRLNGLARSWPEAAEQLFLSGPRLRLWVAAAGEPIEGGYALGLDPAEDPAAVDAALVRAGLAGRVSDDGRHYLIVGRRRLRRLAELVGECPSAAPADLWPGGAAA
jgi:hypothetical protein